MAVQGVTGGVEASSDFLKSFFPSVYESKVAFKREGGGGSPYCTFDNQTLALFTSSLFLAAMCAALPAGYITRRFGRKTSMLLGGLWYLLGGGLNAGAQNLAMLICGRVALGFGVGFANQSVPLFLSEMAPFQVRGALNILFQLATTTGVLVAQLINYGLRHQEGGWRLALGLACVPALLLTLGGLLLPVSQVEAWRALFRRAHRPQLVLSSLIPTFQQWTGLNAIVFFVPQLFAALGAGADATLLNACIIGGCNVAGTVVSLVLADRAGRRGLLLQGGVQMVAALVAVAALLGSQLGGSAATVLPPATVWATLALICVFVLAYSWSWGPLSWLIPSEIQTLETRSAGFATAVFVHFFMAFLLGQTFLGMLCAMQWGVFAFFAGLVTIATIFVWFCVPETKGVPLEEVYPLYARHPLWRRVIGDEAAAAALKAHIQRAEDHAAVGAEGGSGWEAPGLGRQPSYWGDGQALQLSKKARVLGPFLSVPG
ncbi:sugar transport 9 [Chlorella sorokiniana]|uniref:Sugar transport 9 n=1 Tax=Chlorella sorokiniana TaxID=3076 RepID=A0A2P6TDW0_CHLSO|nr:sugar transport 9 [Chlorella sorokiniana]|eukprot:PRW20825.1 sugar transport 9 [Chlorella sorokiniana]